MTDPNDLERIDQEIRINELREAVKEVTGGEFHSDENPEAPPEVVEQFWQQVLDYETAEESTEFERLRTEGIGGCRRRSGREERRGLGD